MKCNQSSFLYYVKTIKEKYSKYIEDKAKQLNLKEPEAQVLLFFYNNKELCNLKDVVEYRGFSKSYVSKALTSLKEKELVSITENDNDKRYQSVSITEKGNEIATSLKEYQTEYFKKFQKDISEEELIVFEKVLKKIHENIKEEK